MRCPRCGEALVAREACRVCGHTMADSARTTARQSRLYRDPTKLGERHMLIRMSAEPIDLSPGQEFTLGRSSDCDLTIHSKNVSRQHARITWDDAGNAVLEDLDSNNGCRINDVQIRKQALKDGDELHVGPYVIGYRRVQAAGSVQETNELLTSGEETQSMDTAALSGRLQDMGLYEVLETLHYNSRTGTLKVFGPDAEGHVGMQNGRAMYAYLGEAEGKDAIRQLLGWRDGMFAFTTLLEKRAPNLRAPLPQLLADYRSSLPGVPKPPPPPPPPTGQHRRPTGAQRRPTGQQRRPTGPLRKGPPPTGRHRKGPPPTGGFRKGPPRQG